MHRCTDTLAHMIADLRDMYVHIHAHTDTRTNAFTNTRTPHTMHLQTYTHTMHLQTHKQHTLAVERGLSCVTLRTVALSYWSVVERC